MAKVGFMSALDYYQAHAGWNLVDYNDICYLYSLMKDNGLTHALCVALNNVIDPTTNEKRFPLEYKDTKSRINEAARKRESQFQLLSFKLPYDDSDANLLSLVGSIEMKPFVEMAMGNEYQEKMLMVSYSLNLLFDLPVNHEWTTGDVAGFEFISTIPPKDEWEEGIDAKRGLLNHAIVGAIATGTSVAASTFLIICSLGIMSISAIPPGMTTVIRNQPSIKQLEPPKIYDAAEGQLVVNQAFKQKVPTTHSDDYRDLVPLMANESMNIFIGTNMSITDRIVGGVAAATRFVVMDCLLHYT
tara:strand:- start:3 stop:905 length:903 start_codon:yes stop_codon:yes gene_type:complete